MRQLIDRGLVEVLPRRRDDLLEEMLAATFRSHDLASAVDNALAALLNSDIPDEVYGSDEELEEVIRQAFESVLQAS